MPPVRLDDRYLPLKDLAEYSGLAVRTLRAHLVRQHKALPHYKIGKKILVKRSEYDAWAAEYRVATDANAFQARVDEFVRELSEPPRPRGRR